jgi:5-methylcytosine-specific restriction enzyme subunit McrC
MVAEIVRAREHEVVELPAEKFFSNGSLQIFDDVQKRGFLQVRASGNKLVFQAGGFVGLIPVNDRITFEIVPRTPIANLDRLLRIANAGHQVIHRLTRSYSSTEEDLSLVDVLADDLVACVREIEVEGRVKTYEGSRNFGIPRSGRLLVGESLRLRAVKAGSQSVVSLRFNRTANNACNAAIKLGIERIAELVKAKGSDRKKRLLRLNSAWQLFADADSAFFNARSPNSLETQLSGLSSKPYKNALAIAISLLNQRSPSARSIGGTLSLSSLVFDLSAAFESYVRRVLERTPEITVLDGNLAPPIGAKKSLFVESGRSQAKVSATPDAVLVRDGKYWCAVDMKYKIYSSAPSREDLNQVLVYGLAFNVDLCLLIYPASPTLMGLVRVGRVDTKDVYCFGIDLHASDPASEEAKLRLAIATLGSSRQR